MNERVDEDPLAEAEALLDEGRAGEALAFLATFRRDDPERALLACLALVDVGALEGAREELEIARAGLAPDDPGIPWAAGELALAEWRIDDARALFEEVVEDEPTVPALDRLALCHDLLEDFAGADALLARAHAIAPEDAPLPPRLSAEDFDRAVDEAVRELPLPHREVLENTRIVIEPMPFAALALPAEPGLTPPDLLGLFAGPSRLEETGEGAELPPQIYLFQRNLERFARDMGELREQIRITLYHEIGHLLGFDEEGVEGMGLG